MSLSPAAREEIERLAPHLTVLTDGQIESAIDSGRILLDPVFSPDIEGDLGQFYAPFDWINDKADIVLVGITPGKHQAGKSLTTLRRALLDGCSVGEAASQAKQAASFDGDMRKIATQLMDRFRLNTLFGLSSCSELFGPAAHRVHYTSILRRPVLRRKGAAWQNYSGSPAPMRSSLLRASFERDFAIEVGQLADAWFVPFGPVPADALDQLAQRGVLKRERILTGLNHPSGTQWNRHRCQLNISADHSDCAPNVGCTKIRGRSKELDLKVAALLAA